MMLILKIQTICCTSKGVGKAPIYIGVRPKMTPMSLDLVFPMVLTGLQEDIYMSTMQNLYNILVFEKGTYTNRF